MDMTDVDISKLKREERTALLLKALYRSYGYREYKLSGFDDYSLYSDNKSFLDGRGVLTFNVGGRLTALRPDVTLSVVKSVDVTRGCSEKLFYDERVYRKASGGGEFTELRQIGVEVVGSVDGVTESEICELILGTLGAVGRKYVLDVSHAGIVEKICDGAGFLGRTRELAVDCLKRKCLHDFRKIAAGDNAYVKAFAELIALPSEPSAAIARLRAVERGLGISADIDELERAACRGDGIRVDFSIGGDSDYYNGVVFKGYADGVPYAVLSGGRYDRLLNRFGKSAEAIGFALYLGELYEFDDRAGDSPDRILEYTEQTADDALARARELRAQGLSVLLRRKRGEGEI